MSGLVQQTMAQDRTITGRVTDAASNEGLPGVTVLVKGTQIGSTTDVNGNYTINAPANAATLVFSFVGYTTTEWAIGNATTINITLGTDARQLNVVVVTVLGYAREIETLPYSVGAVSSENLTYAKSNDVTRALAGKVAGRALPVLPSITLTL